VYILSSIKVVLYEKQQKQWFGKQSTDNRRKQPKNGFLSQMHIRLARVDALDMLSLDNQQLKLLWYIPDSTLDFQSRLIAMHESQ